MKQVIYYKGNGQIDKFTTFVNNNDWCLPVVFILGFLLSGLIDGM